MEIYVDDVRIKSKPFADHLATLKEVLWRIRDAEMILNPEKTNFISKKDRTSGICGRK